MMKLCQFWPKSKALALVLCSKRTQIKIDGFCLDFVWRLNSDTTEPILAKK